MDSHNKYVKSADYSAADVTSGKFKPWNGDYTELNFCMNTLQTAYPSVCILRDIGRPESASSRYRTGDRIN